MTCLEINQVIICLIANEINVWLLESNTTKLNNTSKYWTILFLEHIFTTSKI